MTHDQHAQLGAESEKDKPIFLLSTFALSCHFFMSA